MQNLRSNNYVNQARLLEARVDETARCRKAGLITEAEMKELLSDIYLDTLMLRIDFTAMVPLATRALKYGARALHEEMRELTFGPLLNRKFEDEDVAFVWGVLSDKVWEAFNTVSINFENAIDAAAVGAAEAADAIEAGEADGKKYDNLVAGMKVIAEAFDVAHERAAAKTADGCVAQRTVIRDDCATQGCRKDRCA